MKMSKDCIGLAAEFAVASELCRRNIYAQLTFGTKKRTNLLVMTEGNRFARIEVKAKQGSTWPNCVGIFGDDVFLIFVDFAGCSDLERPAFYVLTSADWIETIESEIERLTKKNPNQRIEITPENVPLWLNQVNKYGQPYRGMGISPDTIKEYREAWDKIEDKAITLDV